MQTKQDLRDALARLITGNPENLYLQEKLRMGKVVKLNAANVEKEARKSNGSIKRHLDVKEEIEQAESERLFGISPTQFDAVAIKESSTYQLLESRFKNLNVLRKKLESNIADLNTKLNRRDEIIKAQLEDMDELLCALWQAIPPAEVEIRMASAKVLADIIEFPRSRK